MSIDNDWLLENLSGSYSLGAVDDGVDSLIGEFDALMDKISKDKRNYMMEAVSTMKDKIITSRVENVLELIDSTQFTDGDEFRTIGTGLTIIAKKYIDGETGTPAWTIQKIEQAMEGSFEPIEKVETAVVQDGYSSASNVVSKEDLASSNDALAKSSSEILVPFAELDSATLSDSLSVLNVEKFIARYIPSITEGQIELVKLTIDTALKNIKISISDVSFIEHAMSDGELKGSGSKLTDYAQSINASAASNYQDTVNVILNYENDFVINVGGVDYTYTANSFDTAEDIAAGLEGELANDANLNVSTDIGFHSIVFENGNTDKVFGWYAEDESDAVVYEVEMVVPTDVSDLMIEQDFNNPEKIIITFEHDGFDPVYPTIGDIRDLVNAFEDVIIRVVVMPGFDVGDEYATADNITLEQGASKVIIEASSSQTVTVSTAEPQKTLYTHVSDFSAAATQVGAFEVIKFNPTNTYYVEIDGTRVDLDPAGAGNESVVDEVTLAQRFGVLINGGGLAATASVSNTVLTLTGAVSGASFVITTSGEFNYVQPIERETLLRYDVRNLPNVDASTISQLKKDGTVVTNMGEPLNKNDVAKLSSSGLVFSDTALMCPQVPTLADETNSFIPKIGRSAVKVESVLSLEASKMDTAHNLVAPVIRSMAKLIFPIYSTDQAKSNRWFFIEAGANSIAAKSTIGVALATIAPKDYERLVLQDADTTFATARENRLPNVGQNYESITALLTEETQSYNSSGKTAIVNIPSSLIESDIMNTIKDFMTDDQVEGFIKYALLPQIVSGLGFINTEKTMSDAISLLTGEDEEAPLYPIAKSSITDSYKIEIYLTGLGHDQYAIRDLFSGEDVTIYSIEETSYITEETVAVYAPAPWPVQYTIVKTVHQATRILLSENIVSGYIVANDATRLYKALMELSIQIDDALREQRFIALAGAYVIDASKLLGMYSDEVFADYVFGINEAETPPENNYGIGGIPIDATVTMGKLYFRNMRNQALAKPEKRFALGNTISLASLIGHMVPTFTLTSINPDTGYSWSVKLNELYKDDNGHWVNKPLQIDQVTDTTGNLHIDVGVDTSVEDRLYKEIARTGYFSTNVDLGLNHASTGISSEFKDSIWTLLTDAFEIADDGSIISINSAKSYIQALYQSFEQMSEEQFTMLLLAPSVYFNSSSEDESKSVYSPLVTMYLKILLYLKEKKSSIDYASWEATFNTIIGLLFMDDEFEEDILSYELFLVWVGGIGAQTAFTWADDIRTDITAIYAANDLTDIGESKISHIVYVRDEYDGISDATIHDTGTLPANKISYSWTTELMENDVIAPALVLSSANTTPVADAGSDDTGTGVSVFTLDGSGSNDADGDDIAFTWAIVSQPAGGTASLSSTTIESPVLTTGAEVGDYVISLVVSDIFSTSAVDTVTITIS